VISIISTSSFRKELNILVVPNIASNHTGNDTIEYLPDQTKISLDPNEVNDFLNAELNTPTLDVLYPHMWLISKRLGSHIDPLHVNLIKNREIIPSEAIKLHLIWAPKRCYLKPIPLCLFNHDFWNYYLPKTYSPPEGAVLPYNFAGGEKFDRKVALGFIRSYAFLITSPLDHAIAVEKRLLPKDVTWLAWSEFIKKFRQLPDTEVANRYHYGQIRMSRLHWLKRIFGAEEAKYLDDTSRFFYEVPLWSITEYIDAAFAPLLFIFASISLALSSMSVILATPGTDPTSFGGGLIVSGVQALERSFFGFSVALIVATAASWACFILIPLLALLWQLQFGFWKRNEPIVATPH
jgi:uncharacterized protein DUF6601